jgi:hypothetical protein
MESIDEVSKSNSHKKGFFNHVFNFDEDSKEEMLNIIQYALLALIPIIILNKLMQRFVPEADENKGSAEILAEIIFQILAIFLLMFFINRMITYIPTYSGRKYPDFSTTSIILDFLIIVLSLQSKLGEKVNILINRFMDLWEGPSDNKKNKDKKKDKNSQNMQNINNTISQTPSLALNQQMSNQTTSLSMLPPPQMVSSPSSNQGIDNYNMNNPNDLIPSKDFENFGPMAANEALGGSGFGATNW